VTAGGDSGALGDTDLLLFRSTVRDFVANEIVPHVEQWEQDGDFPLDLFTRAGEVGLFGAKFDAEWGGFGPHWEAEAIITEELARCGSGGVANALGAHKDLGCFYLSELGTREQKARLLPDAIAGTKIGALAITEPGGGSDVAAITTTATRTADGWKLDGQKVFITNGDIADFVIVAAKTARDDGAPAISLFLVEQPEAGIRTRRLSMLGWRTSHTCELFFNGVLVGEDALIGGEHQGFKHLMRSLEWERVAMAIGSVGAASLALEEGIAYASARKAFGRSLSENPAWRQRLAQCLADLEAARALSRRALELYVAGSARDIAAMAKLVATQTALRIADEVVQIHGGYGYSMEYPAQRYLRDLRLGPIGGGTSEILREVIARTHLPPPD
jgi:acyl-CoA dehydrogenase